MAKKKKRLSKKSRILCAIVEILMVVQIFGTLFLCFYCKNTGLDKHIPFLFLQCFAFFPILMCLDIYIPEKYIHPFPAGFSAIFMIVLVVYLIDKSLLVDNLLIIFAILLLFLGFLFLFLTFKDKIIKDTTCTIPVTAEVIGLLEPPIKKSAVSYTPVLKYTYKNKEYTYHSNVYSNHYPSIGSCVEIKISPLNPKKARYIQPHLNQLLLAFGIAYVFFGVLMLYVSIN